MLAPPSSPRRWRPLAKLWHRWFGILGGLWLLLLAVTGSAITYYDELDRWLNPDWRSIPVAATTHAPLDAVVARADLALPRFVANNILLPTGPLDTIWILGRAPIDGSPRPIQLFADPRDGTVLGWRVSGELTLDRRHAMDIVYGLHVDLLAGAWMTWFFGLVSLAWLIDHAIALWLALPRGAKWLQAFFVAGRKGSLRRLFDLHRAPGICGWPVTFAVALTGVTLAWPETSRDAVALVSPIGGRLDEAWGDVEPPANPVTIERAIAAVTPDREKVHSVRILSDHAAYAVRTYDSRDVDYQGRLWTYVSMADARPFAQRHDAGDSAGDLFFAWQYALHSGQILGPLGRLLIFLSGVTTSVLVVTGYLLWWRRRPRRSV
ncbi:PepSY-associated TM helix domain-containing protein [Sphingomonas aestuarii]